jgi:hypothetical protein
MVTTVTTTTVTTVTTVTLGAALSLVAIVILLALLIQKEVLSAGQSPWSQNLGRVLNFAIVPLGMGFAVMAVVKILEVMR